MTDKQELIQRTEAAISSVPHESGLSLAVMMPREKLISLRDRVVDQILTSSDPDMFKYQASNFVRETLVHANYGTFISAGPSGELRVRLR